MERYTCREDIQKRNKRIKNCSNNNYNYYNQGAGKILVVDIDPVNISSTQVRSNLASGETVNDLILEDVSDYIDSGKLYTKAIWTLQRWEI